MTMQYLSSPKALRLYLKENRTPLGFHAVQFGNMHAWCIGSLPILTKQFNPNFKAKYFVLNVPLASVARRSPTVNPVSTSTRALRGCTSTSVRFLILTTARVFRTLPRTIGYAGCSHENCLRFISLLSLWRLVSGHDEDCGCSCFSWASGHDLC